MAGTAYWSEKMLLVPGSDFDGRPAPTVNQQSETDGTSVDTHAVVGDDVHQWDCQGRWDEQCEIDQRITVNGWGSGTDCPDLDTWLPAFWRFRVAKKRDITLPNVDAVVNVELW